MRGETPSTTDALSENFAPQTKFEFTKYKIPTQADPTDNMNQCFHNIKSADDACNTGIVYISINRAWLRFHPGFTYFDTGHGLERQKGNAKYNVILFGLRNNNTALPSLTVPMSFQPTWHRWALKAISNIDVLVDRNLVISNNRINDYMHNIDPIEDESFEQPGFVVKKQNEDVDIILNEGWKAKFSYNDHYGISVNRWWNFFEFKNGVYEGDIQLIDKGNDPTVQLQTFPLNVEINNNYLYHTQRVAMFVAGNGLVIRNNILRDEPNKTRWVSQGGTTQISYQAYLENRGIYFVGWNIAIENNDVQVWNHQFETSPYSSNDGEGIINQACCGGTQNFNYIIRNNKMSGPNSYVGLYKSFDINNVIIENNDLQNHEVYVEADASNTDTYMMNNVSVKNNINCKGIKMLATKGGHNCEVANNSGTGNINASCFVNVHDNSGLIFSTCKPRIYKQEPLILTFDFMGTYIELNNPNYNVNCTENNSPASLRITNQPDSILILDNKDFLQIQAQYDFGGSDSVELWVNSKLIEKHKSDNLIFTVNIPYADRYFVYLRTMDFCNHLIFSKPIFVDKRFSLLTSDDISKRNENYSIIVFPNPPNDIVYIQNDGNQNQIILYNSLGQQLKTFRNQNQISLHDCKEGLYFLKINSKNKLQTFKITKQ